MAKQKDIDPFYIDSFINRDIFDYQCEVLVIPVSWVGTVSDSFGWGLKNVLQWTSTQVQPTSYELGEIKVHPIKGHPYLRYILFACTVEYGQGSYGAIRKIATELAKFAYQQGITEIAVPLLGTGSGQLKPEISYQLLIASFWELNRSRCRLTVCIEDSEVWHNLKKEVKYMHGLPDTKMLFDLELSFALRIPYIREILDGKEFYYELALYKFREFHNYKAPAEFYRWLNQEFISSKLLFSHFLARFSADSQEYSFLKLCGELLAYIDYRAYLKNVWNEYSDKRVLACSNVRQRNWIQNLLAYKEAGDSPYNIRANSIRNALLYFYEPEHTLTMLSENHRQMVVETFLQKNYRVESANREIVSLFEKRGVVCRNPLNNGAIYTLILYSLGMKSLWMEDPGKTAQVGKVIQDWNQEEDHQGLERATKLIHANLMSGDPELDLGNCGLTGLSKLPELAECIHLRKLILSNEWAEYNEEKQSWEKRTSRNTGEGNHLRGLTEHLGSLVRLETLICGGDWSKHSESFQFVFGWEIREVSVLSKLTRLETLNLSNNSISSIRGLKKLDRLRVLHLNNNEIEDITPLSELDDLEELYLSNNRIQDVQPLADLYLLDTLDLHANQIRDLSPLEPLFERMEVSNTKWRKNVVNVARNPLEKPPVQIIEGGSKAVLQYFKDLRPTNYINKEIKVILVGNSEVGKTTLAKYLNNEEELDVPHSATHWMKEMEVTSKYSVKGVCEQCQLHLFDFGGHDYFHDTHHMFFSTNTLYIFLWDRETNRLHLRDTRQKDHTGEVVSVQTQDYPMEYWLESVQFYIKDKEADNFAFELPRNTSYNSYVLVIQNKVSETKDIVHLNNGELFRKYPFIYDFMHMSIIDERHNMDYFDSVFEEMLNTMPIVGAVLPPYYGKVKEHITTSYSGGPIISMEQFHDYCKSVLSVAEQINREQSSGLAGYLRQIGVILLNDRNREKVYIGKKWIIENIYNVLKGVKEKRGEFDRVHVEKQINSSSKEDVGDILSIMEDFKMIFQHPYETDRYIAPLYLPLMPDNIVGLFLEKDPIPYRRLEYAGFIHKQVILNFFHDYGRHIWGEKEETGSYYYYWKDGLILKDPATGNMVMIVFNIGDKNGGNACIDIFEVRGSAKKRDFLNSIVTYLKEMNSDYRIEEMVTLDGKEFFSLELLREYARNGKLIFTERRRNTLTPESKQEEKRYYKLKDYKEFFMEEGIKKKKVVVSYSKKDLTQLHLLKRYLRPLVDMELIEEPWNCTHNLTTSQEWDPEIQQHFAEADVVIFLVSENFYATRYIVEHEIPDAIDRYDRDRSVKIVPIILEFYDWRRKDPYNLARFTALPYQAKPISDFHNPKMAWYTVAESIKMMLEKDLDPGNIVEMSREIQDIYERQVSGRLDRNSL